MSPTRPALPLFRCAPLTLAAVAGVLCSGCLFKGRNNSTQEEARRAQERAQAAGAFQASSAGGTHRISLQELDQLTYGYADRYFMVMSSAVDAIKRGNPDPVQRRLAHQIKLNGVMAMNDIVSSNDPYSQTLDLVVAVTLQSIVLIDEDHAERDFGDRAGGLIQAIRTMRVEAWQLAAKVLTQEQLELLDYIILEWRRLHPDIEQVAFVKFDNFAEGRATGLLSEVKAGGGFLAPVSDVSQALKDWTRLTERLFWYSKRAPNLAGIEAEGAVNEILSAPEIAALIKTTDRLGRTVEAVPQTIEAQRQAMFAELDARQTVLTNTLADVRHILIEADTVGRTASMLTTNLQQTLLVLSDTLKVGEAVGQRFGLDKPSTNPPARPFDIQDYAAALARLNEVITNAHQLSLSADQITRSPAWAKGIQDVRDVADRRLDHALLNLCLALAFGFVLAVAYRIISLKLARRMAAINR
jgi:hypothetical protein